MEKVLIIGAGGQMTGRAGRVLAEMSDLDAEYVFTDINVDAISRVTAGMDLSRVEKRRLDIYNENELDAAVAAADFVIHGAGPFHNTAKIVRSVCIRHGKDYMDIDDDVISTKEAIELDAAAKKSGSALYVGHGASPGTTNVMARELIDLLDEVHDVEVAWTVGDEGKMELGRAVADHVLLLGAGESVTWQNGKPHSAQSFARTTSFPMKPAGLGNYRLYECAHPEPVTLPFVYPQLNSAICWGGMHPQPVNGMIRGVAEAEKHGEISRDEALDYLIAAIGGKKGDKKVEKIALRGMKGQIKRGENSWLNLGKVLVEETLGLKRPTLGGLAARVRGLKNGKIKILSRCSNRQRPGKLFDTMESITGLSLVAFAKMALQGEKRSGTQFPEAWADPKTFYRTVAEVSPGPGYENFAPIIETES